MPSGGVAAGMLGALHGLPNLPWSQGAGDIHLNLPRARCPKCKAQLVCSRMLYPRWRLLCSTGLLASRLQSPLQNALAHSHAPPNQVCTCPGDAGSLTGLKADRRASREASLTGAGTHRRASDE